MSKSEEWYNAHAKPACSACNGRGMLAYYWSHDDAKVAPCDECFPDDKWATGTAQAFADARRLW